MKQSFVLYDGIGDVIRDLVEMYDEGKLTGIMVCVKTVNEEIMSIASGMNYAERIGVLKILEDDIKGFANKRE